MERGKEKQVLAIYFCVSQNTFKKQNPNVIYESQWNCVLHYSGYIMGQEIQDIQIQMVKNVHISNLSNLTPFETK